MKTLFIPFLFFFIGAFTACEKSEVLPAENSNDLIGFWIHPNTKNNTTTFDRSDALVDNEYGIVFKTKQHYIERKNTGWCGTPPITYGDFDGTWTKNDSIILVTCNYWGGFVDYKWKVISIDADHLTILKLKEAYHNNN